MQDSKLCRLQCASVRWTYPDMKTPIFRRRKVKKIKGKKSKQETRYSFIHFLTWDPELNMPIQAPDNKKMSSRKEIEDEQLSGQEKK